VGIREEVKSMVGIRDIAQQAGVSISTVSYALNGSSKITEETRQRILKIADELNYIPNMAGRALKRKQTNIIGIYFTDYGGYFYGQILEGVGSTLKKHGYELIVCSGKKSHLFLPEKLIDGAIILDVTYKSEEIFRYANRGHNIVVMDRELDHQNVSQVLLDNIGGATLAIDYLVQKEINKVYVVSGPDIAYDSRIRLETAMDELERYDHIESIVLRGEFSKESGMQAAKAIVQEWNGEPVGVFALNDGMAIGMYDMLKDSPLQIGKDIKIIGFDNDEISSYITPALSTFEYSKFKWGAVAAEKIVQLLEGKKVKNDLIYTTLLRRESTE
jgi:DNA-binding LacI/PurR family transcriptional regulator